MPSLSSFAISPNGFLPSHAPLSHLSNPYYSPWETLISKLPSLISSQTLRSRVLALPILTPHLLSSPEEYRRAYVILAFLAQGYLWQGPTASSHLPPPLSTPLLSISTHLEVPPVGCYAAYNLWNWTLLSPTLSPCQPENLRAQHTMTGTEDESWFFMVSNATEARAGRVIEQTVAAVGAAQAGEVGAVVAALERMREELVGIAELLVRMHERCDPMVFYDRIRPMLAGSKNMEVAGLGRGVFYEMVTAGSEEEEGGEERRTKGEWREFRGGSNGQSSLVQFFDVVLGVEHTDSREFHQEMREYMPGPHARLLREIERTPGIRALVERRQDDVELLTAYNEAVASLSLLRDKHIQLVTRYILLPSRRSTVDKGATKDLASASTECSRAGKSDELLGTGGTTLLPFLRQSRNETRATKIV